MAVSKRWESLLWVSLQKEPCYWGSTLEHQIFGSSRLAWAPKAYGCWPKRLLPKTRNSDRDPHDHLDRHVISNHLMTAARCRTNFSWALFRCFGRLYGAAYAALFRWFLGALGMVWGLVLDAPFGLSSDCFGGSV